MERENVTAQSAFFPVSECRTEAGGNPSPSTGAPKQGTSTGLTCVPLPFHQQLIARFPRFM